MSKGQSKRKGIAKSIGTLIKLPGVEHTALPFFTQQEEVK